MKRYYLVEPCRTTNGKEERICEIIISLSEKGANVEYKGSGVDYVKTREVMREEIEFKKRAKDIVERAADEALKSGCAP